MYYLFRSSKCRSDIFLWVQFQKIDKFCRARGERSSKFSFSKMNILFWKFANTFLLHQWTLAKNSILKILKYFIIGLTMVKKGIVQRKNKFCLVSLNFFKKQTKEHFLIYLKIVYTNSFSSHLRVTIKILRGPAPIRKA